MDTRDFIDLNRQFMPFSSEKDWELSYNYFGSDGFIGAQGWEQLLQHRRIVLLAEAGAGKTAELRAVSNRLKKRSDGLSFYLTLNAISSTGLESSIETAEELLLFSSWKNSNSELWLIIDSLDEARLNGSTFRQTLSNLQKELHTKLHRVRIIVSCRVSDWRSLSDARDFQSYLGVDEETSAPLPVVFANADEALLRPLFDTEKNKNTDEVGSDSTSVESSGLHIVALAPLTSQQAEDLAAWVGVVNVEEFMQAIHEADATDLANRPQDLISLADQWKAKGIIGGKYDALKWSIETRLQETNLDLAMKDNLNIDKAYSGAKKVAALLTFGKQRLLSWPLEAALTPTTQNALDPRGILTDFSGTEVASLLNRAIFDPATLGAVRFHHRSAQELLCAEWLSDRLKDGCPLRQIWNLLTEERYGKIRFRPALRPITAWLAQMEPRFFKRVVQIEPQLLIEDGDPRQIPIESRKLLLNKFAEIHANRNDSGISIDINQVARIASSDLHETIRELWARSKGSGELRDLLLRLIWAGEISELGDVASEATKNSKRPYEVMVATRAIMEIGTSDQRLELENHLLAHTRSFPQRAIDSAIVAAFQYEPNLDALKKIIGNRPVEKRRSVHIGLSYGLERLAAALEFTDLEPFSLMLEELVRQQPRDSRNKARHSKKFHQLLSPLMMACARICETGGRVSSEVAVTIRHCLRESEYSPGYHIGRGRKKLVTAVTTNRIVNKQLFDLCLQDRSREDSLPRQFSWGSIFQEAWTLKSSDFGWLLNDMAAQNEPTRKLCLLFAMYGIAHRSQKSEEKISEIRQSIIGNKELEKQLDDLVNPPPRQLTELDLEHAQWERRVKEEQIDREAKNKQSWIDFRDRLRSDAENRDIVLSFDDLYHIVKWQRFEQRYAKRDQLDWSTFEQAYGIHVTRSAKSALINYWRSYDPGTIKRQGGSPSGNFVSLAGLEVEATESPHFASNLTEQEIRIATRHAWTELNKAPEWAKLIWLAHPEIAAPFIRAEMRWELRQPNKTGHLHHIFFKLSHETEPFRSLLAKWSLDELCNHSPSNLEALRMAIETITGAEESFINQLSELSTKRFNHTRRFRHKLLWVAILICTDADKGLGFFEIWLSQQRSQEMRDVLAVELLATLFPDRSQGFGAKYQDYRRLPHLNTLLEIAYRHVRHNEDIAHDGVFTSGSRDHAQDARNVILGMLLDIPGKGTVDALLTLADKPELELSTERFQTLADKRATMDADIDPWSAADLIAFTCLYLRYPRTQSELFSLICDRLVDIQDEMESSAFSNKAILRQDHLKRALERPVQLAIAQQFEFRRGASYSNVREPEQEDYNEPDILIQNSSVVSPLPVEIKVADSWSYRELREAIRDQLIGKYLKEKTATHGVLLMTHHGKKKTWHPPENRKSLSFPALLRSLQAEADKLCEETETVDKIKIVGISLI